MCALAPARASEGGVFPRGIVVGEVVERGNNLRVEFGMTRGRGGFVRLMPSMTIPTPEDFPAPEEDPAPETAEGEAVEAATAAAASEPEASAPANPGGR